MGYTIMTNKLFRVWLQEKWYEHKYEILEWERRPVDYDLSFWFNKYKWWLRREFRHQTRGK